MNTLLERITAAGITFVPNGDKLKVRAPGPIPPDLIVDLRAIRADLLDQYNERAGIMEYDGGMDRAEAERRAAADVLESPASIREGGAGIPPSRDYAGNSAEPTPYVDTVEKTTETRERPSRARGR